MTDMNTGMPFWWTGANPVNVVPPNQALANNLVQNKAAMDTTAVTNADRAAGVEAEGQFFYDWSRNTNDNVKRITDAAMASSLAVGPRMPVGTYNGNALSPFATGTAPIQHLGGTNGLQPFNPGSYLVANPDVFKTGTDPWQHYNLFGQSEGRTGAWGNTTFDMSNYLANNPDVFKAGTNPIQHWLLSGYDEGRQGGFGGPDFNEQGYAQHNPDIVAAGMDPTGHYLQFGMGEGRQGGWGDDPFNAQEYLLQNRDVAATGTDPLQHWMNFGYKEGRDVAFGGTEASDWGKYFDTAAGEGYSGRDAIAAAYLQSNPDVLAAAKASRQDPTQFGFEHLTNFGMGEDRSIFDAREYLRENPDVVAAGADPYQHWRDYGQAEGRFSPMLRDFDPDNYRSYNQDVADAGMDPWLHYTQFGLQEGREGAFEGGGYDSDPGFDTVGYFMAHPEKYREFLNASNEYTDPTAFAEMANYESPGNDYKTFQKGPTYDWQSSIPEGLRDPRVINEIYKSAGETRLPPAVIAAILRMESVWNPRNTTGTQYGLAQMSGDMWGDNPFRGTMGGVDFNTYRNDTVGDKQIRAYTDWLIRGGKLNRNGLDVAAQTDPAMQAAMLQAIQFAGNSASWRNAYLQGNRDVYVTTAHPQAAELRVGLPYPTINSMYDAYSKILGGWTR